jgi:hypothetical protein
MITRLSYFALIPLVALLLLSACALPQAAVTPVPATLEELDGLWRSDNGFYILFDTAGATFSASFDQFAAEQQLGILGTFRLQEDRLILVEDMESESCPGLEGQFKAELFANELLLLTIIDDPCLYRVEGVFQGGQGDDRSLAFRRS